jgi:hypothetical protein
MCPSWESNPDGQVCSQSLHELGYPSTCIEFSQSYTNLEQNITDNEST